MSKPWVVETEDDPHRSEGLIIRYFVHIARNDRESAERLVGMPFLETIEHHDVIALETLSRLLGSDPDGVREVLSLPELADGITDELAAAVPLFYLELRIPEAAAAIKALPWFQDKLGPATIDDDDRGADGIGKLQYLAVEFPQVFWAVMGRPWIQGTQEGLTRDRVQVIDFITSIAQVDVASTLHILELPFLESIETEDERTLETLLMVFWNNPEGARALLSDPALLEGMRSSSAATVALLYLKAEDSEVSEAIEALPWVQDGLKPPRDSNVSSIYPSKASLEYPVVLMLLDLYLNSREACLSLVQSPWVHEGFDNREYTALGRLLTVAHRDPEAASRIMEMPFLKTFEWDDLITLETMETLARSGSDGLQRLLSDPALHGGITDDHMATVALLYLKLLDPGAAAAIGSLPWVQDGIAALEERPVLVLQALALESQRVFWALTQMSWVQDGLSADEVIVVGELTDISGKSFAQRDEAAALRIIDMPFLETIDGLDAAAMRSLSGLALWWDQGRLQQVLSHPTLSNGITDDQTVIVAALGIVEKDRPELLGTLLDPEQVTVEGRVVQLPHSGEMTLWVINVSPGAHRTMDILEQLVRTQEGFMAVPFPTSYLVLLVADATRHAGGGGPGGVLTVDPGSEEDRYLIAHELAHSYWNFAPLWLREGAAEFMTTISAGKEFSSNECSRANNLSDLERLTLEHLELGPPEDVILTVGLPEDVILTGCHYRLGRGLYIELYETLREEAFRQGFRRLYLAMRGEDHYGVCAGPERGVCYVTAAFVTDALPEPTALAEPVIARWYYGPPQSLEDTPTVGFGSE